MRLQRTHLPSASKTYHQNGEDSNGKNGAKERERGLLFLARRAAVWDAAQKESNGQGQNEHQLGLKRHVLVAQIFKPLFGTVPHGLSLVRDLVTGSLLLGPKQRIFVPFFKRGEGYFGIHVTRRCE